MAGLQNVRSQRKAHWVETHAAMAPRRALVLLWALPRFASSSSLLDAMAAVNRSDASAAEALG